LKDGAGDVLGDLAEASFTGLQRRGRLALFGHIARNGIDQAVLMVREGRPTQPAIAPILALVAILKGNRLNALIG
jgi:hypothetical protein